MRWLRTLQNLVPARLAIFNPIVEVWRGKAGLDLGCGGGFMAVELWKRGARISGLDPSVGAIDAARRYTRAAQLPIDFRVGNGCDLPYRDATFDFVVCADVFEHIHDLPPVLSEIRRVLRPGGLLFFDTISKTWLASFVMITIAENWIKLLPRGAHDPLQFMKPKALAHQLEAEAFEVGKFSGFGPTGLNSRLDITFGRLPTTAIQYAGHARRIE